MAKTLLEVALKEIYRTRKCWNLEPILWTPTSELQVQKEVHKNILELALADEQGITNWWQFVKKVGLWHLISAKFIWDGWLGWITLERAKWVAKALKTNVETLVLFNAD